MRISLNWLQDFVEFTETDVKKITDAITTHTAEVEEVEMQGALLEHCCVGKVLTVESHPDADKLSLCDVQTDKGTKRVVCGGSNLRAGMRVAFAHVGATVLWHGGEKMTLESAKIRGKKSEGMICAAEELGLSKVFPESVERIIVDMGDDDEGVGQPLREFLGLNDVIFHIDNHAITQRADLFSHIGFARECVAMGIAKWKSGAAPMYSGTDIAFATEPLPFKILNEDDALVPRYMCCLLEVDDVGETPDFMKARLASADWRSINLPVDITNFVSTEVGMPLHSFDADDIQGDVHMRAAKKGEKILTLDEEERELPEGALVLSDDAGIFDLLGVMGGLRTSTTPKTRRILLHSAAVDPVSIRRTIVATGHRTEAATVYEKGIAPVAVEQGFYRALELFLAHVPGARIVSVSESWGENGKASPIEVFTERVCSLIGAKISAKQMVKYLEALDFSVDGKGKTLTVTPPLHRLRDCTGEHDIIEEIARVHGFNEIEPVLPFAPITLPQRDFRTQRLRNEFQLRFFIEILPLSLLGPDLLTKCEIDPAYAAVIHNPLGEELSLLQPSVLPRLLEHAGENIQRSSVALRTFHIGTVFTPEADKCIELGMIYTARKSTDLLEDPFLSLKRDLCASLEAIGYTCTVKLAKSVEKFQHPAHCVDVLIHGKKVGSLFEILPAVRERFDLPNRTAAALIDLSAVLTTDVVAKIAQPLPQFPLIVYDETLMIDHSGNIEAQIVKAKKSSKLLESIVTADLYKDQLTLRFTYRAQDRTLKEDEAKEEHEKVISVIVPSS